MNKFASGVAFCGEMFAGTWMVKKKRCKNLKN